MTRFSRWRRLVEYGLITGGIVCLATVADAAVGRVIARRHVRLALAAPPTVAPASTATVIPAREPLVAMLDIQRLGYSEGVAEGDDAATLRVAIGHLPDTAVPWVDGNTALAAHRDALFRPLRQIRVGDEIRLETRHGDFLYRVRETRIVDPSDVSVLASGATRELTLITCYPFYFIGSAPKRFVVTADAVEPPPDGP